MSRRSRQPVRASALGITRHKKPTTTLPYCLRADPLLGLLCSPMGLCQSVAPWKEKVICVDAGRAARRVAAGNVVAGVKDGGCCGREYRVLGGDDAMEIVEKKVVAVADPAATGVGVMTRGVAMPGAAISAGGTPARPIWQRRVLMGVKCQMPRFSGMILYDESGRPVCGGARDRARDQEKHAAAISVLRDML